jgi:alanine racemase
VGYADGYFRYLSSKGIGYIENYPVPIVGRISMDLITFNITGVPKHLCQVGKLVDLIGPNNPVDVIARSSGTIGYEVLTSLGTRFHRRYMDTNQAGKTP